MIKQVFDNCNILYFKIEDILDQTTKILNYYELLDLVGNKESQSIRGIGDLDLLYNDATQFFSPGTIFDCRKETYEILQINQINNTLFFKIKNTNRQTTEIWSFTTLMHYLKNKVDVQKV